MHGCSSLTGRRPWVTTLFSCISYGDIDVLDHRGDCRDRDARLVPASPGVAYLDFGRRIDSKRYIGNEIYFLRNSHYHETQATGPARRYSLEP